MTPLQLSTSFVVVMALLALSEPVSRWARLPRATVQMILGAAAATAMVSAGFDTGLRFQAFHDLVFYVFLPVLIFEAAYAIDVRALRLELVPILSLSVLGLAATCVVVAAGVYYGIGHPGFPWAAALLTGTLLAATDPAAVTSQMTRGTRLAVLLEGESLFNDATAVVLFALIITLATTAATGGADPSALLGSGALMFAADFAGGVLIGAAAGVLASLAAGLIRDTSASYWLALAAAYGGYAAADSLGVSGAMAVLVTGLILGRRHADSPPVWQALSHTATGALFLLMGATLQANMFERRWLAMLIAIGAVFVARTLVLQVTLGATNMFYNKTPAAQFSWRERSAAGALGMRGAITVALALTLPTDLPYWWTIQSIAYGVVFFDMCVTAPLTPMIVRWATRRSV